MDAVLKKTGIIGLVLCLGIAAAGQSKGKNSKKSGAKPPVSATLPVPEPSATPVREPAQKNEGKANSRPTKTVDPAAKDHHPTYFYTFERPGFPFSKIVIEHDDAGVGEISMKKDGYDELYTDPLKLSPATLFRLNEAFAALNFLNSTEEYQYHGRDYSHLGNVTITRRSEGKERTAKLNWTDNKEAKILLDEYRGIANEYTWKLEFASARQNQPLLTPGLIEVFDGYVQRNEVTDPPHLIPFLRDLAADERIPLIGRNRASRIVERIEKAANKH